MKILILIGSLRKNSWNRKLAVAYQELAASIGASSSGSSGGSGASADDVEFVEGRFDTFPLYSEDIQSAGFPPDVLKLGEQIRSSDAVLFISPEYNYSVPGVLKNALDWISRLPNQPFAR